MRDPIKDPLAGDVWWIKGSMWNRVLIEVGATIYAGGVFIKYKTRGREYMCSYRTLLRWARKAEFIRGRDE